MRVFQSSYRDRTGKTRATRTSYVEFRDQRETLRGTILIVGRLFPKRALVWARCLRQHFFRTATPVTVDRTCGAGRVVW